MMRSQMDECAPHKVNVAEVTKHKMDHCETRKKTKEIPVVSDHDAGAGDKQALSECGMCHNSVTKDIVTIRKAKRDN